MAAAFKSESPAGFVGMRSVRITAHQFRHLSAELYLREDPNGIGIISQHLGHRDLNTTKRFYAREQTSRRRATTRC
jgi:integrase